MRGDAVLGALMHVEGADLDLHRLATGSDDRRMQRLVEIKLRHRDVVFETAGNRVPASVQRPQHAVAILDRLHQDTHSHQIEDLIEGLAAHDHLLVDRVVALRTATHRPLRARATQILFDLVDDISQVFFALGRPLRDEAVDLLVDLRVQRLERQLLKLPLHHVHAKAMSQGRVDLQRLLRLLCRRLGGHEPPRTGIMQAVAELDEQHTDIAAHRDKHLAQGLGLGSGAVVHLIELGDAINEVGDCLAILGSELLKRVVRVLDRVMQQRCDKRRGRHAHLRQNGRNGNRMGDIRFTGLAHLPAVVFLGSAVGPLDDVDVRLRMVRPQGAHKRLNLRDCGASA